ncbi:hypothetical protein HYFRA_00000487 [Hymenoscyphus fraxineus]|uniref:Uncharacterized protein n=1 Tax=Hymenoscyphus fraxineus TaxID=746836 RepID=A0A9N9L5K2_9HELO|nr:hypothetical protein HYFRA_00000487 [Hymenoscyphus fraxineus]
MHSSWSFTAGVVLLSTCSAKALTPRAEPSDCSVVPHVYYPKVINTCCDKATTITVEECSTEIVLPTGGCIDTTITQTVTKERHHSKTETAEATSSSESTISSPTSYLESSTTTEAEPTSTVVYKRGEQGQGGNRANDFYNRKRPWQDMRVYNPTFEGKNFDSDGNGDNRGNKLKVTDKSTTTKHDNSRILAVDESGDYRDNDLKYHGGEGNGDGSMYNTGSDSGNNRDKGDYRDNDLKYFDASKKNKVDVDVNKNRYANKKIDLKNSANEGSQNSLKKETEFKNSGNQASQNELKNSANEDSQNSLKKETEFKNSGNQGSQNALKKTNNQLNSGNEGSQNSLKKELEFKNSGNDQSKGGSYAIGNTNGVVANDMVEQLKNVDNDGSGNKLTKVDKSSKKLSVDVDNSVTVVKLENYRRNRDHYRERVDAWYTTGLAAASRCTTQRPGDDYDFQYTLTGFYSKVLRDCIELPIETGDIIVDQNYNTHIQPTRTIFITQEIFDNIKAELEQAGLDELGLPMAVPQPPLVDDGDDRR